jgi:hypothetical protein
LRLHIDVNATDGEQEDELERLLAAGARRVDIGQTGAEPWHVLADPEGNELLPTETSGTKGVADQSPDARSSAHPHTSSVLRIRVVEQVAGRHQ